jgi:hypothetical protein
MKQIKSLNEFSKTQFYGQVSENEFEELKNDKLFVEIYDKNKIYTEPVEKDLGFGPLKYTYYIINCKVNCNDINMLFYDEVLDDATIEYLGNYCQCYKCKLYKDSWFFGKIKSMFTCSCCVGCINSDFPQSSVVYKTREYIIDNKLQ